MARYITKRVLRSLITMFIIITILFALLRLMPVEGYFENYDKMSSTQIQVKLQALGVTAPLPTQLVRFYKQVLHGDLGESNVYRKGVAITEIIAEKIPISLELGLISLCIALALGLPLGVIMARSTRTRFKIGDRLGTVFIVLVQAMPSAVYHNIKSIADEPDGHCRFEDPAHDERRLKLRHIVVLGDHLDEFITGDKGQDDACDGQHHIPGEGFDHCKHPWFKAGGFGAHLLGDVAHLGIHIVEQPAEIGHNACRQDAFDPVGNGFENGFHSAENNPPRHCTAKTERVVLYFSFTAPGSQSRGRSAPPRW